MRFILITLLACVLAACQKNNDSQADDISLSLNDTMGGKPKDGFSRALKPRIFSFPNDHTAHSDYATEWWYFTGNLKHKSDRPFGYQLTIFRIGLEPGLPSDESDWRAHQVYMGHLAISDIQSQVHHSEELFSRASLGLAGTSIQPLRIWLGPLSITSLTEDVFPLQLSAQSGDLMLDLRIEQGNKPMVLQGDRGLSQKGEEKGNASYYYSHTRLPTFGSLSINSKIFEVQGNSWFDREWSSSALADDQAGWDWFALQLDDGRDLMFYRMRDHKGNAQRFSQGILVRQDGTTITLDLNNTILEPTSYWISSDGLTYPVTWKIQIKTLDLDLKIKPFFNDQLMSHTVRYWEGAIKVDGSHTGRGYMELSGYSVKK